MYNRKCPNCKEPAYQGLGPIKCSNDYCELAEHPRVNPLAEQIERMMKALEKGGWKRPVYMSPRP